jgi:TRAP-type mannitol/chloroaromatic compound transport system permease small subunit
MLDSLIKRLEAVSRIAVWIGGAMLFFAAFMVTIDVLIRATTGRSMGGSDEISGYLLAISTSFAFSYALLHRINVRVDALYLTLRRPLQAILDVCGLLILTGFVIIVTWRAIELFTHSATYWAKSITPMQTPLAVPQFFWVAGFVLFTASLIAVLLRCVIALSRRDLETVAKLAGARTQIEEVDEEVHQSELRVKSERREE